MIIHVHAVLYVIHKTTTAVETLVTSVCRSVEVLFTSTVLAAKFSLGKDIGKRLFHILEYIIYFCFIFLDKTEYIRLIKLAQRIFMYVAGVRAVLETLRVEWRSSTLHFVALSSALFFTSMEFPPTTVVFTVGLCAAAVIRPVDNINKIM